MENCIFCKIVKGDIPSEKVFEDDKIISFMDINPNNKGHTLVITKEHYETFDKIPQELLSELTIVTQKVAKSVSEATSCHGFNIVMNNEKAAGQLVPHVHFHIIPRFENDGVMKSPKTTRYGEGELKEYADSIRKRL
jgi:histidine triad (HIT) family protein